MLLNRRNNEDTLWLFIAKPRKWPFVTEPEGIREMRDYRIHTQIKERVLCKIETELFNSIVQYSKKSTQEKIPCLEQTKK